MFKVRKLAYRPWPVNVSLLDCDPETARVTEQTHTFIAHWKPFSEIDLTKIRSRIYGDLDDDALRAAAGERTVLENARLDVDFLAEFLAGWEGVFDGDGAPIAFDRYALDALCLGDDGPAIRRALHASLNEIRFGVPAQKNSLTSPQPGPTPSAAGGA